MGEAIVVTSGKGGVGKTTISANIGAALALSGKKVLLIDTDIGLRNLDVMLGLENRIVYDIVDVCEGNCDIKKAVIKDKRYESLFIIPAAQAKDKSAINSLQMKSLIRDLKNDYDYIIIDCPAGIEQGFENAVAGADSAVVVVVPQMTSLRDADRIIGLLENRGIEKVGVIVNKVKQKMVDEGKMPSVEEILDVLAVDLLGVVPDDDIVIACANTGSLCVDNEKSLSGKAFINIGKRIMGEKTPLLDLTVKRGLLSRIFKIK